MLSYSGLVTYGKTSLPSVESWNTNNNIVRDPPRSFMTRRKTKVSDTSEILATLAESDDRFCEAINYYARGVNPMVSVTYGEGQTIQNTSSAGQSYLPYRIMNDGAFRPPIKRQEDLLPLSRLPRNWTTIDPRPFEADYTKKLFECGTAETTKQVKNEIFTIDYETGRNIPTEPNVSAPDVKYGLKEQLSAAIKSNRTDSQYEPFVDRPDIALPETRLPTIGHTIRSNTNYEVITDHPDVYLPDRPIITGHTIRTNNREVIKDRPSLILAETRLPTIGHTIRSNTSHEVITERPDVYLPDRPNVSGQTTRTENREVITERPDVYLPDRPNVSGQTTRTNPTREVITERPDVYLPDRPVITGQTTRTNPTREVITERPDVYLPDRPNVSGQTTRTNPTREVITERPDIYLPDRPVITGQTTRTNPTREVITERPDIYLPDRPVITGHTIRTINREVITERPDVYLPDRPVITGQTTRTNPTREVITERPDIYLPDRPVITGHTIRTINREVITERPDIYLPDRPVITGQTTRTENREVITDRPPIYLPEIYTVGGYTNRNNTNYEVITDHPSITLPESRPTISGQTNAYIINEQPITMEEKTLKRNHPLMYGFTNRSGPNDKMMDSEYGRLVYRAPRGGYEGRPGVPVIRN